MTSDKNNSEISDLPNAQAEGDEPVSSENPNPCENSEASNRIPSSALLGDFLNSESDQKVGGIPLAFKIPEEDYDRILAEYNKIERRLSKVTPDTLEWCCLYVARQSMCWAFTNRVKAPFENIKTYILTGTPVS